jgi:hypothetical protein
LPSSPINRRQFLGTSLKLGAGAAALGLTGVGGLAGVDTPALASRLSDYVSPLDLSPPPTTQTFVSRPDLRPPGIVTARAPGVPTPGIPSHIFLAPHTVAGSSVPATSVGLMICDLGGNLVWWRQLSAADTVPLNLRVQTYQGQSVLTWYEGTVGGTGYGTTGTCFIANNGYHTIATAYAVGYPTDLHEFLITPEDTALVTAYEPGPVVIGHAQEVSIGNNDLLWDWASYPAVPTSASYVTTPDYFHINSVDLWPGSARNVLVSARNTWGIYLISRATKEVIWSLGGKHSSFALGPGTKFSYQHDARPLFDGSGVSLFDDASAGVPERQSWGKVISLSDLNKPTHHATLRHEFSHTTGPLTAASQGNCQLLPTGGHFVGWGTAPWFSMFGPSGNDVVAPLLLDGRMPDNLQNYRAFMFDWTGRPAEAELALVVHNGSAAGEFTAYASWNGATQVALWQISAGTSSSLRPVTGLVNTRGFETAIPFSANGATDFQVAAVTQKGAVIGRSRIVGVTS